METNEKSKNDILKQVLMENYKTTKSLQQTVLNMHGRISEENRELVERINSLEQKIDKLANNQELVNSKGNLRKSFRDYSDAEIYELRWKTSLRKCAERLNCSTSTIQRICRRYRNNDEIID